MIILKILLIILLAVLGLILLLCIVPIGADVSFIDGKFRYKVRVSFMDLMDSEGGGLVGFFKKRKSKKKPKPARPQRSGKKKSSAKKKKTSRTVIDESIFDEAIEEAIADTSPLPETETTSAETATSDVSDEAADEKENSEAESETAADTSETANDSVISDDDEEDDDEEEDDEEEASSGGKLGKLIDIWNSAKNPLCMIFKGFKFSELYLDLIIADEDAYKCALNYGKFSGIIYNGLALFSRLFTVRLKTVDIQPGFGLSKSKWDAAVKVRFRIGTAVIAGIWFLITYIFRVKLPAILKKRKAKKLKNKA